MLNPEVVKTGKNNYKRMDIKKLIKSKLSADSLDQLRFTRGYLYSLPYMGTKYKCPICGGSFRVLLAQGRTNAVCPRCGSKERHRLIWWYLKEKTNFFTSKINVLHFAPEFCFQRIFRSLPNLDYISADLCSDYAMLKINITDICFDDNKFDCILCSHVLEHIVDDRRAIKELYRVLKPNGFGIFLVPMRGEKTFESQSIITPEQRLKHYGQEDHVRIYGKDFKTKLEDAGFTVKVEPYLSELDDTMIDFFRLVAENPSAENIYLCSKDKLA
jgi:SAM-dependent methyltransferase